MAIELLAYTMRLDRGGIAAAGDSYTGADPMDATPGGRRLATPRGNTLVPLGVRTSHP